MRNSIPPFLARALFGGRPACSPKRQESATGIRDGEQLTRAMTGQVPPIDTDVRNYSDGFPGRRQQGPPVQ